MKRVAAVIGFIIMASAAWAADAADADGGMNVTDAITGGAVGAGGASLIAYALRKQRMRIDGQPLSVTLSPDAATKSDVEMLKGLIEKCASRGECSIKHGAIDKSTEDLYAKLHEDREKVSAMRAQIAANSAKLEGIDKKLDIIIKGAA